MGSTSNCLPRTLLPKSDPDSSLSPSLSSTGERGEPPTKRQRKCISSACMPCRKRKSKCDGERPTCSACSTVYGTECIYDLDADHRRKGALKRDIAGLTESNRKIGLVIEAIRKRSEADVDDIIQLIRAEPDLNHEDIAERIESLSSSRHVEIPEEQPMSLEGELVVDFGSKSSIEKTGESRHYGTTSNLGLHPESQRDFAMDQVGAWTTVTNDQGFINHLLELYFTWTHPWYLVFSEEVFYHGLEQRKSKYCTPLLMNAILAIGCFYSDRPEARVDPNDPKTAGDHFFAEARRLLGEDENRSSLTIVQALALMSLRQAMHNMDSAGRRYTAQMMSMAIELGLHNSASSQPGRVKMTSTEIEARRVTFWGCFVLDIGWSVCAGRISFLPRNAMCIEKPSLSPPLENKLWKPHGGVGSRLSPLSELQQPSHKYGLLVQVSLISEIMDDIIHMFYAPRDRITSRRLQLHHEKIQTWYGNLPDEFAIRKVGPTLPQIITLHIYYHTCALVLFRPYMNWAFVQQMSKSPRQICTESANTISSLVNLYLEHYSARRIFFISCHSIMSAAIIHLANLNRPSTSALERELQATNLASAITVLNEMQQIYIIAGRIVRILASMIYTWTKSGLPEVVKQALDAADLSCSDTGTDPVSPFTTSRPHNNQNQHTHRSNSTTSTQSANANSRSNSASYASFPHNTLDRKPSAPEIMQMAPPSSHSSTQPLYQYPQNGFFNPMGGFEGIPIPVQDRGGAGAGMALTGMLDGEFPDWNKDGFILEQGQNQGMGGPDFSWGFSGRWG